MSAYHSGTGTFTDDILTADDMTRLRADLLAALLAGGRSVADLPLGVLDGSKFFVVFDAATMAPMRVSIAQMVAFDGGKVIQALHAYGHAPNPMPTAKMDLLRVGAAQQFGEILDAVTWANPGATILVDDGAYYAPTHTGVPNLTIQSVSGNPFACYMDGEGGNGGGKRLAYGKGMLHCGDVTTVIAIGFKRCGSKVSAVNLYSNESGVYAEQWPSLGALTLVRCSFDDCGDGVFIPHGVDPGPLPAQPSANIQYVEKECLFAYLVSNSHSNPADNGPSHDRYIGPISILIDGSYMYGNDNGHSLKGGAPNAVVRNCPWIASWGGRAIESPYGGTTTVINCTLVSRGDPLPGGAVAVGNFIGVADEYSQYDTNEQDYIGCTFLIGRSGAAILMPNGGTLTATNCTEQWFDQGGAFGMGALQLVGSGTVSGLALGKPADGDARAHPGQQPVAPPKPAWAYVGAAPPAATGASVPAPAPVGAQVGQQIIGATSAITPSGALAWGVLHDGSAEVGPRQSFGDTLAATRLPAFVPASANATHTLRIFDAAVAGNQLAASAVFTVAG